jgi:hypothetical protein
LNVTCEFILDSDPTILTETSLDIMSSTRDGPEQDLLNLGGTGIERHHEG